MVQDVEKLCPELDVECFRYCGHTCVLEKRQVHRGEPGTIKTIAATVPQHVGTVLHAARSRGWKEGKRIRSAAEGVSGGCDRKRGRRGGWSKTIEVQITVSRL